MVSKNNIEMKNKKMRDEKQRFSIRKFSVGAASVLIGLSFSLYNGQQASADTVDNGNKSVVTSSQDKEQTDNNQSADTNTQNKSEEKSNTNQAKSTVTDDLDHSTVVSSYKAHTPNNASEFNKSSENTESKSDEKQTAATETVKTEETATKEVETKNTATNDVAKKNDEAAAKTNTATDVNKKVVKNVKTEAATPNVETKNTETQTAKTDEEKVKTATIDNASTDLNNSVDDATTEVSTNTFNVNEAVKNASFLSARAATESKVTTRALAAEAEDPNAVTVTDARGLINAIQKGSATTINVANDINLATVTDSNYTYVSRINTRDFTIKSATNGVKHTIDFSGYVFNMSTPNTVTFKDLDIYARSYWGVIYNAGGYVYDNVDFTGSQLIYTASNTNATVTFKNKVTATTVGSYTSPIDGKSRSSQGGDTQQILQFEGGRNHIIFDGNSNVTLGTTNSNVLEIDGGTATIDVKNGANVTINPHSKGNPENSNGIRTGRIARAIASNANTTINVDKGANLTINTEKASGDSDVAGALYLNSDATLNVNGDLNINSTGTPSTRDNGYPVYIAGNAAINVGNGGKFNLSATNTGSYNDNLMSISGKGTVKLAPHSNFKISADGTGALTAINLSSGSTFTSDQPDSFAIDLSANTSTGKSLIKNGTINFTRVKTVTDGNESQPLGKIDVTYDRNGNATSYTITSQDENTVKQVGEGLANKNLIDLVKAGEDVTLSNLHLSKNNILTGTVASSGSNNPIYVTVTVGGVSTNVPVVGNYTVYTNTNGTVTSDNVDYAAQTASTGGNFSIDLSKLASSLTDDAQVAVTATKDFVESSQTESVAALRALNTTTLQELVDAAPEEEKKASYYNATEEAQKAYTDAISTGKDILANPNNYDQVDVDDAVTAIQNAQKALTGKETNKTELQDAIDQASTVESSNNYTNADANLQRAYTDAISAGQTVLSNANATQTEVDNALTTINNAKDALNGDAKKAASKEALQKAVDEAPTVKSDDAAYYNGSDEAKTAYDKAVSAGQTVLADPNATATQITDALNAINTAKGNLKGEATDKSVLQKVVDNSATVKESNNYTNADETQKTAYDNAVTAAQTVLDKTNATQAEVNQALQDLETANNNLNGDAKTEAANKAALEAAVKDAPNVRITPAYYNGSEEAQTAYNSAITAGQAVLNETNPSASDVKNALDAINAAKDNLKGEATNTEALETALTNANNTKETGNYTNADQANQEALNNAITAGQEILKNTNATQAEVNNAAKAITDAINGLNGDSNLANAKIAATEDIQKALDTKTTEITDATNIDQVTKDQLIADAKKAAEDANTAINQATDANAVNTAKTEGITKINKVKIPSLDDAKTNAAKEIDQALADKTKEINNVNNIDQATKDQLIQEATDAATTAKAAIEKATTNDAATKAGQDGVDAINNVKIPSVTDSQNAAKEAIDDALNAKTKEINDANNIDQTTKDQLIKEATDAANNAKEAIDQATTADAIKTAQDEGTTNINNVTVPSLEDAKKTANKAVDDALTAQTEVINKADNLSDAEKKDLIDQATAEANKAKENIETATTNNEAAQAGQAGVDAIKKIGPTSLDTVKSDANKAIDNALTKKLEEINSASDLTTDEKTALIKEANTAADKAKEEITKATTNDAVIEAQTNGVTAIDGIKVPTESAVKEVAKKAVADAATAKNNAIDASNLTDEEKATLKQEVTEAQNAADQAIDNATTNAAVTEAQTNGVNAINGIKVPTESADKEAAKKAVADAATAKNNAIDASNLTDEEKAALKQAVTEAQNVADQAIDNATTNAAVTEAQTNGVNAINGIKVPTESADKEAAKKAVADAATAKNTAIDSSNLTDEEKATLKQKVTEAQNAADQAIDKATTNAAVTKAQTNGVNAINGIKVPTESADKEAAKKAVADAATAKNTAIDSSNLTDEEKAALKQAVTEAQNVADQAIDNATTNAAVTEAQTNGVNAINGIKVPTESADKEAAKKAVADAATAKNTAIDSSNLTDEEKATLKQKVTEAQNVADQAIDNATTNAAVTEAQTNGVNAINGIKVPTESADKEAAKKAVADAATAKNTAIDSSNLTDEEKAALKQAVTEAQNVADQAIDNATTNAAVTEAQTNGVNAINGIKVPTESADKEAAKKAVADAATAKNTAIDSSNLTDEEKATLKQKVTEAQNAADQAIDKATTNAAVTKAQTNGVNAINGIKVPTESADKEAAKKAVADAATAKNTAIDSSNLTDEEKAALKQAVTEAQNAADQAIDNATTNAAVTEAQTNGMNAINGIKVSTESTAKEAAKKAVAEAADAKNNAIDSSNLTDEEKAALKQEVTEAQNAANTAIDNATTNAAVTEAEDKGIKAINGIDVPAKSATKEQAITDLNTAVDEAKKAIDQDSNLTDEQKQAAKDQINSDAKSAQDAINNAKTNDDVKNAAADGTLAIDKDVANAAIDNAVAGKKSEISNLPLTDEEKTALNNEVDQKANTAKEAINTSTTPEAVATAQENGIKNINDIDVPTESAAKQAAKEAVANAANEKNAAIDSSNLTAEEKAALKQKVTEVQNAANTAIDNATTNAAVTEAKDNGISAIDGIKVPTTSANKEKAITDLNNEVENAKKAIDQDSNLTDEQKQAAKDQIDSDAKTAQDAINNAKTDTEVNNAVNSGKVAIDKEVANAAIDNAVAGKLKEIQDPLTTDEKQAYTDLINSEANNAKQNIANATTVEEVTTAQTNGVNEINNTEIPTTSSAKDNAIAAINDALQKKTDEINNASNINAQEKTDLINQATEAANAAKNNINNATTNVDVDTAQTNGEKAIADVTVPNLSDIKKESIDLINKALDAKTEEINNASNLSQDEKQGLINAATNAATEAINSVNQSQTNDDAKAAANTGVQNIENVTIPSLDEAKKNANQAIEDALNTKVNEINNASNLNDTEKQKLVDQATEAATTAKNNVEKATTNDDARDAANAGIDNIKGITFTSLEDAKNAANTAIDNALQVKTNEINNASNLSTEEKQDLINQASEVAKNAKDNINNATTNDAVTDAQNKGIADIANVTVPSLAQAKQDAINAIKQVQDAKNKQISAASNLSAEEQKELSDQVDKIANDAIDKINESSTTTNDAVTATRDDAIKQITDLFIPTLEGAQTDALNAIESAKNAKLTDINNATHLTDQEKQALVDQTNKAADDATKEIKGAQTNDAVKSAETAGLDNINNITIPTLVQKQQEAIEELNVARDAKNKAIDDASDLTTDEKNSLKDKVQAEYSNAVSNITSATTDEAVTTAKEDGIAAIKDIQIPTKSPAKEQATIDLNTAVDEAKNAIDQDNNLTDEEKQAAKDQIDSDAKKAQEAIDNATTDDEVNTAVDNGKLAIDKDVANAAIDNAVSGKKNEISKSLLTDEEKAALNDEVDEKAQAAKDAINNVTTPEAVSTAQENGIKKINDTEVPTESAAKEAAKKAVAEAADAKNNAIDSSNLTAEEKAALKQEVTEAQNAADRAIDAATTNTAVTEAQDKGVKAIDNVTVPTESAAKEAAKKAVAEAADAKNNAIDSSNLTAEEKAALKQEVAEAQNAANTAIDNATTNAGVTEAEDNGVKTINGIEVPTKSTTKEQATSDLNTAVDEAKNAIDQDNNLTDEEKQTAKDQIDSDAKKAQEAIDNAKTNDDVKKATDDGTLAIDKDVANAAIDNAVAGKKAEISKSLLTDEEKAALNDEVDEEAQAAKDAINNATTPEAVSTAQENGIKKINDTEVPTESAAKEAAKKVVAEAADAKNNAIDSSNLTAEEKAALKQEVAEAQNAANTAIDNATTNAGVTEAEENGVKTINGIEVPTKSATKDQATTDLNNEVDEAKKAIDQDNNLTDEEKQAAKDQIDSDAKTAQDAINNAKTNEDVKKAVDDGRLAIDKDVANAAIDNAVAGKKAEISKSPLTDEEKAALNNEVDQKAQDAKEAVNNATTPEAVSIAQESGIKNINNTEVPTESVAKEAAKKAVAEAAEAKNNAIDSSNLTAEEKAALKQEVAEAQNAANTAIDNATTNAAVAEAQNNGIDKINSIEISAKSAAKEQATTDLNNEVDEAKKAIDQDNNLTDEQKQAAKDQIDSAAKKAQEAIDNAKSNDDVKKAVDDGKLAIDQDVANAAIDDAAAGKLKEISDSLTDEEKQAYTDLINNEADNAKQKIAEATTPEEVTRAQEEGVKNINNINVPTTSPAKDAANAAIDQALKNKKDEINNATNISSEEKTALINQATEAATTAKDNINNATTNSEVETAQVDGEKAIADITVPGLSDIKKESIDLINKALNEKQEEINNASNLSQDEKQELIDQAKKVATEAINEINNAQTNDEAKEAADTGVKNIENVSIPSIEDAKRNANQAIDDALNSKKNEINNASNLTDSEKTDLINQAAEIANAAKAAINSATTNTAVEAAEDKGVADINNIHFTNLEDSKKAANNAIEDALNTKKDEINHASNLSNLEKANLINQATEIANAAKAAINNATTNAAVTAAENKGIENIANVNVPSLTETKQAAIDAIKQVQKAKNSQIEEAKNLSTDEQKNLIDQVNKIAQDAINKLNDPATTTNEVITDTRDKAIDQITNLFIPTLDSVQKDAQEAINSAKEAKIDEINKADNLTDQMKQNLIDQVNQVADNATKAINNAQTNDDVKEAETEGLEDINSIQVPSLVESKDDAIKEIDDALEKKTDEIMQADLDQKQKDELISQITDIATETKTKVFNATTNAEVDAEAEAGIKAIEAVKIPARAADNSNTESHDSSTNVTPDHNNEENNTAQNTNQVSTNTESESKEQTVITNSVQPKRNAVRHKNGTPVNKKATLPQTGKKNSSLTLAGAALLGLTGVLSLFGLGDKRKKNN
ncbi:DUF1542 domain-containing protein [Lactobacillus taiwanensis]|uniref:DUF1542 domain-containing protein n=1 Tax=Lactobacillus taiwanensis TaxID=508451 RepID=UPI001AEC00F1|nr:DUF1542 domain-containing protein [Lactobacillus taiwanensis]QTQ39216.1 DUF1542 domain-containing protein [Lactobacillus taiwanensis]